MIVIAPAAVAAATASATAFVPASKGGISNTPIGPFQTTVPAERTIAAYCFAVSGPMSSPSKPSGISPAFTIRLLAADEKSSAQCVSTGSTSLPAAFAISSFARSILSFSTSDFPVLPPWASENV